MTSCCFTGHRTIQRSEHTSLSYELYNTVHSLIEQGVSEFYAGGALGFDTLAAKCILSLKTQYPQIKLVLILPFPDMHRNWNEKNQRDFMNILNQSDKVIYACPNYTKDCYFKRNRMLVASADCCVCYLRKSSGGTLYTVNHAKKLSLPIYYV